MNHSKLLMYSLIDCTAPSDAMIDDCLKRLTDSDSVTQAERMGWDSSVTKRIVTKDGFQYDYAFNRSIDMGDIYKEWAIKNVSPDAFDFRVVTTPKGAPIKGPHVDHTRNYTLIYLLESGGQDHETCFYKDIAEDSPIMPPGTFRDDLSQVQKVAGIQVPLRSWTLLNAHVLHGVENIPLGRMALQVSIDQVEHLQLVDPYYYFPPPPLLRH